MNRLRLILALIGVALLGALAGCSPADTVGMSRWYFPSININGVDIPVSVPTGLFLRDDGTWQPVAGALGGTVTDVSVITANGFAGTVATSTSTPAITLSTTVTGLLKGNGTAISAATAGTDYLASVTADAPLSGAGTPASHLTIDLSAYLTTVTAGTTYVPYTGATGNINLNAKEVTNGILNAMTLKGTFTASGTVTLPAWTMGGNITGSSSYTLDSLGHVGIGVASVAVSALYESETFTITDNGIKVGGDFEPSFVKTSAAFTNFSTAVYADAALGATNTQNWSLSTVGLRGVASVPRTVAGSTGTVTGMAAFTAAGTIADAAAVTNWYGLYVFNPTVSNSKLTNAYSIFVATPTGGATSNYALYINGGNSYFGGNVGFGTTPSTITRAYFYYQATDPTGTTLTADYLTRLNATTGANANQVYASRSIISTASTNTQNWTNALGMVASMSDIQYHASATGTVTGAVNFYARNSSIAAGTVTNRYAFYAEDAAGAGTLVNQYMFYSPAFSKGTTINEFLHWTGQLQYSAGAFAFQANTTISSTGTLTINAHTLGGTVTLNGQTFSGAAAFNNTISGATGIITAASAKVYPTSGVAGFSVVSTALTLGSAGSVIIPQGNMSGAANDAARDTLAGNVGAAIAFDSADDSLWIRETGGVWKHVHVIP